MAWDDDDWVGTPPEGHHTKEQSNASFWAAQRTPWLIYGGTALLLVVIVVVVLVLR
jgi:hypothetical protein